MPTLLLVDSSLSMGRVIGPNGETGMSLVVQGIKYFLERLKGCASLEYVSLASFSHEVTLLEDWTRDLEQVSAAANRIEIGTKPQFHSTLTFVKNQDALWAPGTSTEIILLTYGHNFLRGGPEVDQVYGKLLPITGNFHVICLRSQNQLSESVVDSLQWLVKKNNNSPSSESTANNNAIGDTNSSFGSNSISYLPTCTEAAIRTTLGNVLLQNYSTLSTLLRFGTFNCPVQIKPSPKPVKFESEFESRTVHVGHVVEILGFLKVKEWGSPPTISRHLIIPSVNSIVGEVDKVPNFCLLLHGALKLKPLVAVCRVAKEWYGMIYHLESKKSNLVLHCLQPGTKNVPWLGRLNQLDIRSWVSEEEADKSPFPLAIRPKPSYAVNSTCSWTDKSSLTSDISKVSKYAKKLPERKTQFYTELNRVVKQALSIGFGDLLCRLVLTLEEIKMQSGSPEVKAHIKHAITFLRDPEKLNYANPIPPM